MEGGGKHPPGCYTSQKSPVLIGLTRNYFKFYLGGFQQCRNKKCIQIFDIISTSEDFTGFSQLSTKFALTIIVFERTHDAKNLNKISVSTLLNPSPPRQNLR